MTHPEQGAYSVILLELLVILNHIRSVLNCFRSVLENDDNELSSFSRTDLKQFRTERMWFIINSWKWWQGTVPLAVPSALPVLFGRCWTLSNVNFAVIHSHVTGHIWPVGLCISGGCWWHHRCFCDSCCVCDGPLRLSPPRY